MGDIYKNIEEYNPKKKRKILIYLMIWFFMCLAIKKLTPIGTESFIRRRKLSISSVFITQSFFTVLKNIRLHSTHYFVIKIPNKREL